MCSQNCGNAHCGNLTEWPCDFWRSTFIRTENIPAFIAIYEHEAEYERQFSGNPVHERMQASRERSAEFYRAVFAQRGL